MSMLADIHTVFDDEVWGMLDQAMTYIKMITVQCEGSPNRKDLAEAWFAISFPTQDVVRTPNGPPSRTLGLKNSQREAI